MRKWPLTGNKISGITKYFTSGAGVPTLKLSFVITGVSQEESMDEDATDDNLAQTGMFGVHLWKRRQWLNLLCSLGIGEPWKCIDGSFRASRQLG